MTKLPQQPSLEEVHGSVETQVAGGFWRRLSAFMGPAYLIAVGYMDPGNWATDIAGGSKFGYTLLWVLVLSNMIALLLQSLSARLGLVRRLDLAQASRLAYPPFVNYTLYGLAELAIAACDMAEVLGMAIGVHLLTGIPMSWAVVITLFDTVVLMLIMRGNIRRMESIVLGLITTIGLAFLWQVLMSSPHLPTLATGLIPSIPNDDALYITIGIIGATVMPHNLYLHSALVQTRRFPRTIAGIKEAIKFNFIDSAIALNLALFVNGAILVVAAAAFYTNGLQNVTDIADAYKLLAPLLGSSMAPILFAIALIASGQSSTVTGTLAGQVVMEGYLGLRMRPWIRRLLTRSIAIVPAVLVIVIAGDDAVGDLLVLSQVVLSLQLGFAVIPLIHFVSDKAAMRDHVIGTFTKIFAWLSAAIIVGLNGKLVYAEVLSWMSTSSSSAPWIGMIVLPIIAFCIVVLLYITIVPIWGKPWRTRVAMPHDDEPASFDFSELQSFKRVAVTVDFSSVDESALRSALSMCRQESTVVLIHVVETVSALVMGQDALDAETSSDRQRLDSYAMQIKATGRYTEVVIGYGNPRQALPKLINESLPDLLVMAGHGHSGIGDLVHGATIDAVRHKIQAPVFVIPGKL
ncbi:MAG: Nramp family divalent metal transporter [Candidatus Kapabacteria bacterium]|nr:Nramp family divalent metal transporter [Candidatus Kapabacteria bacterium]